jgi:hypothetical protein
MIFRCRHFEKLPWKGKTMESVRIFWLKSVRTNDNSIADGDELWGPVTVKERMAKDSEFVGRARHPVRK